jgi:transposase-like protein
MTKFTEKQAVCKCPHCETTTVVPIRDDPAGVQLWRCSACGEIKRWCPCCDQGWIARATVVLTGESIYVCQECDVTWTIATAIGGPGASFEPFLTNLGISDPWQGVEWVPEYEK